MSYNPNATAATPQIFSAVDNITGLPLAGGQLWTYASGTITPQATYTDNTLTTQLPNPIILDNYGQAVIWLGPNPYRFNLLNTAGVQQAHYPQDNIQLSNFTTFTTQLAAFSTPSQGQGLVGFNPALTYAANTLPGALASPAAGQGDALVATQAPFTGAAARTQHGINLERISAFGFGALGDASGKTLSAVTSWGGLNTTGWTLTQWQAYFPFATALTNTLDWCALQALLNAAQNSYNPALYGSDSPGNGPCECFIPSGEYWLGGMALAISKKVAIKGEGPSELSSGTRIVQNVANVDLLTVTPIAQGMSFSIENITVRGVSGATGDLVHVLLNGTGKCNSQRYLNVTFGTPSRNAINIEAGDDIMIRGCLYDVSAGYSISLGTTDAAHTVSNISINDCNFFNIPTKVVQGFNVNGFTMTGCRTTQQSGGTIVVFDGLNTLPYQLVNIKMCNNQFVGANSIFWGTNVNGLEIDGNNCPTVGLGVSTTDAPIHLTGTNSGVKIGSNRMLGATGGQAFIANNGTISKGIITGNTLFNNGTTTVAAFLGLNQDMSISDNNISGFTLHSISEHIITSGNSVQPTPSVITTLATGTVTMTVAGAQQSDLVQICPAGLAWFAPAGFVVNAFVSAPNTVTINYTNVTAGTIGVPASDITLMVRR